MIFWSHMSAAVDDDMVFTALADPTGRFLLDPLFARGRTWASITCMNADSALAHIRDRRPDLGVVQEQL